MAQKKKVRIASITRNTKETKIRISMAIDGSGKAQIESPLGFWNHMLTLLAFFGRFDLSVKASGDIDVDEHHLVEDLGICFGSALARSLGDKRGIRRFGWALVPMDETLVQVAIDISGRPYLSFNIPMIREKENVSLIENAQEFMRGFANHAGITLHFTLFYGENCHHICEAMFKGLGLALRDAVEVRDKSVSSTKGCI
jgi:imidazoleglycerol-phosphate dehydratase